MLCISGSMANPCISHLNFSGERFLSSEEVLGHVILPHSTHLYKRRKLSHSHRRPLILVDECPQNRNRVLGIKRIIL